MRNTCLGTRLIFTLYYSIAACVQNLTSSFPAQLEIYSILFFIKINKIPVRRVQVVAETEEMHANFGPTEIYCLCRTILVTILLSKWRNSHNYNSVKWVCCFVAVFGLFKFASTARFISDCFLFGDFRICQAILVYKAANKLSFFKQSYEHSDQDSSSPRPSTSVLGIITLVHTQSQ